MGELSGFRQLMLKGEKCGVNYSLLKAKRAFGLVAGNSEGRVVRESTGGSSMVLGWGWYFPAG